ncbi:MAG: transporter permease [Rhizobium sp.]|nr:transporter permease [Rhizobium sp.]
MAAVELSNAARSRGLKSRLAREPLAGWLSGYGLMAPAMILLCIGVLGPCLLLAFSSFWMNGTPLEPGHMTLAHYVRFFSNPFYLQLLIRSIVMSLVVTLAIVVLSFPIAYLIAMHGGRWRMTWIVIISLPFWTSYLLRIFAWKVILGFNGVVNSSLMAAGLISQPLDILLYNPFAVVLTLTHAWMPFVVLPIYVSLMKIPPELLEAATDLGDGPMRRFLRVTLPLALPGVASGALLVFIPTVGDYVTPMMVGGPKGTMIGTIIAAQFGPANNWPLGSAISVITMVAVGLAALLLHFAIFRIGRIAR